MRLIRERVRKPRRPATFQTLLVNLFALYAGIGWEN
jgi:hypothetical protein